MLSLPKDFVRRYNGRWDYSSFLPQKWSSSINNMPKATGPLDISLLTSGYTSTPWLLNARSCKLLWKVLAIKPESISKWPLLSLVLNSHTALVEPRQPWLAYFNQLEVTSSYLFISVWTFSLYWPYQSAVLFTDIICSRTFSSNISDMQ